MKSILEVARALHAGDLTSRSLLEQALARAEDQDGEGARVFIRLYREASRAQAETYDNLRSVGIAPSPLAGIPISVKDLFDVAGERTLAGSVVLKDAPPAEQDAAVVRRLRAAGAVIIGRTNMTEFAYSGVGLNPHYGTPRNPYDRATRRIPGGSSSGAAVSVTDGMAVAGIGTDTGGSVRIPAALCGITGFKPTARRIPLDGAFPLSTHLDSIGPLAPSVSCCAILDAVMAGEDPVVPPLLSLKGLRLAVPQCYVLDPMDQTVATTFSSALTRLSEAGAQVLEIPFTELEELPAINAKGGLLAAESYAIHRHLIAKAEDKYDPRVLTRIRRGADMDAAEYIQLLKSRKELIRRAATVTEPVDALLMPTVPQIAPPIAALEADDGKYFHMNALMLRNPAVANFFDWCALSVPCHAPGEPPVGLMLMGEHGADRRLLSIGLAVESILKWGV